MTLSNHFPFQSAYPTDTDTVKTASENTLYENYCRGVRYTDYALGTFFKKIEKESWAENTIFVVTSDNGIWIFPEDKRLTSFQEQEIYCRLPALILSKSNFASLNFLASSVT